MAAIICTFFGVVIAVNMLMAVLATRTFGGTVVDNSYVASQKFNGWLAQARAQQSLGWQESVRLDSARRADVLVSAGGKPLDGMHVTGYARHPLGREPEIPLNFAPAGDGRALSDVPLPGGRWYLHLTISRGPDTADLVVEVQ
jgi:nitrogen fixation protein FixH